MEVPVKGEMIYQDYRAPENKDAAAPEGPTVGSGRGETAFRWSKWLVYDQPRQNVTMSGDVLVVHHADATGGQPFNVTGQTLIAELEPDPAAAAKPDAAGAAKAQANDADQAAGKFRLKRMTVRDHVGVESTRMNIDAQELNYDPLAQVLTATGNQGTPVVIFDKTNGSTTTAGQLDWNTRTDQFKVQRFGGKMRR
jgi:hypothetical protein